MRQAEALKPPPNDNHDLYPTRGAEESIFERADPVVFGRGVPRSPYSLTPEQLRFYEQNGYLIVPGVFTPGEVELFKADYLRLARSDELRNREELILEPDEDRPRSIFNLHRFSELFDRLSRDSRILEKVTQILDSEVYIHHARINIKRALKGKSFPWHSDFETWHAEDGLPRCRILSAWIMLTENDEFNGPLYLIPGSHRLFVSCAGTTPENHHRVSLRKQEYGVPSGETLRRLISAQGLISAHGTPGTLILHEGNTLHASPDNLSTRDRTNLFFVYNSVFNLPEDKPFAAAAFRPEFLAARDFRPLKATANRFS